MPQGALVWFRNDLRLTDNPALSAAMASRRPVRALYLHETDRMQRPRGAASRWWLHRSLNMLAGELAALGVALDVAEGGARRAMLDAVERHDIGAVYFNRRHAPAERDGDDAVRQALEHMHVEVRDFGSTLLVEPSEITTKAGGPYAVFTPFFTELRRRHVPLPLPPPPAQGAPLTVRKVDSSYRPPAWTAKLDACWTIGERAAQEALDRFLSERLARYVAARDLPAEQGTSRLSPHLAFGEISPRQIWHATLARAAGDARLAESAEKFLSELGWREFNYQQLFHRPNIAEYPMRQHDAVGRWRHAPADLAAWQAGETGIPIVDAGMRELWATGYMENRVRMLAASLLSKNLLIDWREGERWFWDTLVDADIANNPGNWQWVAGSGLDAAPWFRIFNPATQGERFDAAGDYVRRWVPEVAGLPDALIHAPWTAGPLELAAAGIRPGDTYPEPIVDLKASRARALAAAKAG